jgi:hypothetical protein
MPGPWTPEWRWKTARKAISPLESRHSSALLTARRSLFRRRSRRLPRLQLPSSLMARSGTNRSRRSILRPAAPSLPVEIERRGGPVGRLVALRCRAASRQASSVSGAGASVSHGRLSTARLLRRHPRPRRLRCHRGEDRTPDLRRFHLVGLQRTPYTASGTLTLSSDCRG